MSGRTLILDTAGTQLSLAAGALEIRREGHPLQRIPASHIERIVCAAAVESDTHVLARLNRTGITVVCLHRFCAPTVVAGQGHGDIRRLQAQFNAHAQPRFRQTRAGDLVRARLVRQRRYLRAWQTRHSPHRRQLFRAVEQHDHHLLRLVVPTMELATLRGIEGAASAAWFEALATLLPPESGFDKRRRRPPPDPANACLSLAYTLLQVAAVEAITVAGLHPNLGVLHEAVHNRASLACDLMEPLRPCVDSWVLALFKQRCLRATDFDMDGDNCHMHTAARGRFYQAWEHAAKPWRRQLGRYANWMLAQARAADKS